jgi:hypothetical protein
VTISLGIRLLLYASFVHHNDFDSFFMPGFDIIFCLFYSGLQDSGRYGFEISSRRSI